MRIGYLGAGTWGFCLASLLAAKKEHQVVLWTRDLDLFDRLFKTREHPKFPGYLIDEGVVLTQDLSKAVVGAEVLIESVTSSGVRPVLSAIAKDRDIKTPLIFTSKGIEQESGLLLPEVAVDLFGDRARRFIGCLSGPSHAEEVIQKLPTSVVCSSYDRRTMALIQNLFSTPFFRVYPNDDMYGVSLGGALKNIIAIACGISDGLGFGDNTKAALMTRGLHEIRKLALIKGARSGTLSGLSGMGDLCVTCLSTHSRNYRFGLLIAKGYSVEKAKDEIGMAVEGAYTVVSALQLADRLDIKLPITQAVYSILYDCISPILAVEQLLSRPVKEEHL